MKNLAAETRRSPVAIAIHHRRLLDRLLVALVLVLGASRSAAQPPDAPPSPDVALRRADHAVRVGVAIVVAPTPPCPRRVPRIERLLARMAAAPDRLERWVEPLERAVSRCDGAPVIEPAPAPDRDALVRLATWPGVRAALRRVEPRIRRRCIHLPDHVHGMPMPGTDTSLARGRLVLAPDAAPSWPSGSWDPCVGRILQSARMPTVALHMQFDVRVSMAGDVLVARPSAP